MSASIVEKYYPGLTPTQRIKLNAIENIYKNWNWKINLISRKDMDLLYERHVLHSLGIAKIVDFRPGTRILDVGTGGGFPGIPLAILFPNTHFFLVDSIGKKIRAVEAIAHELAVENVTALQIRGEKVNGKYDFVVSRAVAPLKKLYLWSKDKVDAESRHKIPNGLLCLKGGDLSAEIKDLKRPAYEYALSDYFQEEFFETKKVVHVPVV